MIFWGQTCMCEVHVCMGVRPTFEKCQAENYDKSEVILRSQKDGKGWKGKEQKIKKLWGQTSM